VTIKVPSSAYMGLNNDCVEHEEYIATHHIHHHEWSDRGSSSPYTLCSRAEEFKNTFI